MKRSAVAFLSILAVGCVGGLPPSQTGASLLLKPRITEGYLAQATVSVYDRASIHHLVVKLFQGSTEVASRSLLNAQLDNPIAFSGLKPSTSYTIKSYAYLGDNTLISQDDASSWLSVTVNTDDRPTILSLPVHLVDRLFNGQATGAMVVNPGSFVPMGPETAAFRLKGIINTVVGNGVAGYNTAHEGVHALAASILSPYDVAVDGDGCLYIADYGNRRIRKVSSDGIITTIAGNGSAGYNPAHEGGPATSASMTYPASVAVDTVGNVYFSDRDSNRIRKVLTNGTIVTVAGNGMSGYNPAHEGVPATSATISNPLGLNFDKDGNLYIGDLGNSRIRKVSTSGVITTVVGNGTSAYNPAHEGVPATSASLQTVDFVLAGNGDIYVADYGNNRIRKISNGIVTTYAGNGTAAYNATHDGGPATMASIQRAWGIVIDPQGNLYFSDENNNRIRRISPDGIITTIAGHDGASYDPTHEWGVATAASLNMPTGLCMDKFGDLYVADYGHSRIRKIR